jgi:hypothetical protein
MYTTRTRIAVATLALAALGLAGTACSEDDADAETAAPATTAAAATTTDHTGHETTVPATTEAPASTVEVSDPPVTEPASDTVEVVEVHAADYGFGGLPQEVAAGTTFSLVNDSTAEVHEIVAVRLPDTETRSVYEIVQAQDFGALFASEPALVIVAGPNQGEQMVAVGDGSVTEPGRYAVLCFIPTGADPAEYFAAAAESNGGPPQVEGGAPHIMNGMYAELLVTA